MKIDFQIPKDGKRHRYCQNCHSERVKDILVDGKKFFLCGSCGKSYDRIIDLDPKIVWWIDSSTKELWNESVAVFVISEDQKILLIERTLYPYGLTIASGHLDSGEDPKTGASRELKEETSINTDELELIFEGGIKDVCLRGADYHFWHLYRLQLKKVTKIVTDIEEGKNPKWFSINEIDFEKLVPPVRYFLQNYLGKILN